MHLLTDSYIKPYGETFLKGQLFFRFEIYYDNKAREYLVQNDSEYREWIFQLKMATKYSEIFDFYEVISTISFCEPNKILKAKHIETNEIFCIKSICKTGMSMNDREEIKVEAEIMKVCQHPNIVKLYDVYDSLERTYLVLEYCEEGDLYSYLSKNRFKLPEIEVVYIIKQILYGLYYLHQYNITHRDLKPENILISTVNGNKVFKLADFGLSKFFLPNEECYEPYGTLVIFLNLFLVLLCS